jgi:acyl carrier protein
MPMDEVREKIQRFIVTQFSQKKFPTDFGEKTRLRTSGLLDSLAIVALISYIEKEYAIEFSATELTVDAFDTLDQIAVLIAQKKK